MPRCSPCCRRSRRLTGLVIGPVYGWADIVTIGTPVEAPYYVAVVPYFAAWLVALVGTMLATRWLPRRRTALRSSVLLIGPVVLYLSGILLGTDEAYLAGVRGVAFAVIALVWLAWRRGATVEASGDGRVAAAAAEGRRHGGGRRGRHGRSAPSPGSRSAPVSPDRFVLRDEVVPPFDPLEFPSPLAGFRNYTKDLAETPLFEVSGLEPGDVIRLATMDAYTGRLWNVAGPDDVGPDGGGYGIVGETLPEPLLATLGSERRVEVQIEGYDDVWLPTVGYGEALSLEDRGTSDRAGDLRYNPAAGTAVLTSGVAEGAAVRTRRPSPGRARDRRAARHAGRESRDARRRERPRRGGGEGRRVRRRGDDPDRAAPRHRDGAQDQRIPQPRARLRHGAVARRSRRRPHHRAVHAHPDGGRRGAVRLGHGVDGPPSRLSRARRHGLRARGARGRAGGRGGRRRRDRVGRGAVRGRRLGLVPPDARPGRRAAGADAEAEVRAPAAGAAAAARGARRGAAAHDRRDRRLRRRPRPAVRAPGLGVGRRSRRSASPRRSCSCRCSSSRS